MISPQYVCYLAPGLRLAPHEELCAAVATLATDLVDEPSQRVGVDVPGEGQHDVCGREGDLVGGAGDAAAAVAVQLRVVDPAPPCGHAAIRLSNVPEARLCHKTRLRRAQIHSHISHLALINNAGFQHRGVALVYKQFTGGTWRITKRIMVRNTSINSLKHLNQIMHERLPLYIHYLSFFKPSNQYKLDYGTDY